MAKRKTISKKARFEVFKRDAFTCQYCGRKPPDAILEIDHIVAVSAGGSDDEGNLITACFDCNRGKGTRKLTAVPDSLKKQMALRKKREEQVEEYNRFLMGLAEREDAKIEALGRYWFSLVYQTDDPQFVFGPGRVPSMRNFLRQLTEVEIREAVDIAHSRGIWYPPEPYEDGHINDDKVWKYFCGVCWNKIRSRSGQDAS